MNILFLTNAYPDFDSSYRGIFVKKMATLLKDEGYSITVVTPKIYKKSYYFEDQAGIKVYRFPFFARNKLLIEHNTIPYLRMALYHVTGLFLTVYAIFRNKCDMIHTHWAIPTGLIGAWAALLLRKPLIVTIHGSDLRMALERPGFLRKIFAFVCKKASHINCVSNVQKKEMGQIGDFDKKISVVPMGIDEVFIEKGRNRRVGLNKQSYIILSNRNLLPIYNISLLIHAIPIVLKEEPEIKFLIAGDGPEKEALETEVKDLEINSSVTFLGRVLHEDMPDLLSRADVYVSTSLYDGTSVSLLEAMGSGAFPIVTGIPSNREWISDEDNGFLISQEDKNELAKRIVEAVRNHRLLEEACTKNQEIVRQRAYWSENVRKITRLYQNFA